MMSVILLLLLSTHAETLGTPTTSAMTAAMNYQIGPGDTLQIVVYGEPTLTGSFPVNQAGYLEYPLLGSVQVAGLTTDQVVGNLSKQLSQGYLRNPKINAWVSNFRSQPVQVIGAVSKPGLYFLQGPTTVLEILSQAGGVGIGGVNEIRVVRGQKGDEATILLSYDDLIHQGLQEFVLESGDIIYVPQSTISVMGQVGKPGDVPYREDLTVSLCVAAAGGALPTAALGHVYVFRGDQRIAVDLKRILNGKSADFPVKPGDRIVVQESVF